MEKIEPVDDTLAAFLRFNGLLGDSVLFFFREQFRKDARIQATQTALQQERISIDVKNIQATLDDLKSTQEKYPFLNEIAQQVQHLEQWQVQHEQLLVFQNRFAEQLDEVLDWAKDVYTSLDEIKEDVAETKETVVKTQGLAEKINQKLDNILTAQQQNHSAQINHRDGTMQYAPENQQLLKALLTHLQRLSPQEPLYGQVSNKAGRALSSSGALDDAERLFVQLIKKATHKKDQALAYFNLFQVRWRKAFTASTVFAKEQLYAQALAALTKAIKLSNGHYALHDINKGYFPIKKLLGAGGMGCALLCQNQNELTKAEYPQVVVKCFWENISGDLKTVFKEPFAMHKLIGQSIPKPLDYGYADNRHKKQPYFVTEYIDGAIDGEAWLEKVGAFDLTTGLQVAVQIAKALQRAHEKGVCHLDLKPANLLLKKVGEKVFVKVIDFGLARVTTALSERAESRSGATVFGQTMFDTLDYAPPEQRGYAHIYGEPSAKSDVFAFGMTMYQLWTGEKPHPFVKEDLPNLSHLRHLLSDCVKREPAKRPESAHLVKSLMVIATEKVAAKTLTLQPTKKSFPVKPAKFVLSQADGKSDKQAWQQACKENTLASYQAYLNNDGTPKKYAKTAQYRIQVLLNEIDDQAWNKARQENTVAAYQTYLNGNTLKKHAGKAQKQLKEYQKQLEEAEKHLEDEEAWQWTRQQNTKAAYQAYLDGDTLKKYAENAKNALQDDRYIDNDDGAVTDTRTGLVWLKNANCLNRQNLETAMQSAAELAHGQCGLSDGSKAGDWRLPTKDEWEAMIDESYQNPVLSNAAGTGQWTEGDAFVGVQCSWYWSSSTRANCTGLAWRVYLYDGDVNNGVESYTYDVWPVRGGH
jgi:serine/threonine protein kinase